MDAFKATELARMQAGGNEPWHKFWEEHESTVMEGKSWDDCTIRERYDCEAGEEYKARLTAKVEGREYVPGEVKKAAAPVKSRPVESGRASPAISSGQRTSSPAPGNGLRKTGTGSGAALGSLAMGKKAQNEAYFAKMGAENANRSEDLPPSQGGKFTGFGSDPWSQQKQQSQGMPGADEFQKDPLAALTKGFGWFGGMVQKNVNQGIQKVRKHLSDVFPHINTNFGRFNLESFSLRP